MKTIAFYLPQFHEVYENNIWWGKGYTEWSAVVKAKPLFWGHYQPTEPLEDNYYNLLDIETFKWQAALAREFNVYGFCFYHYWFSKKLLLEKPAELLLKNPSIDIHYCFSWANETWKRTWSHENGNDWNEIIDSKCSKKSESILIKQKYGDRREWKEHFMYLLKFFQDTRYIKVDNKPVFILYKPQDIKCLHSMLKEWDILAKEHGFSGLYIIGTNAPEIQNKYISANLLYEPSYSYKSEKTFLQKVLKEYVTDKRKKGKKCPYFCSYTFTWNQILKRKIKSNRKTYFGGFVNFDNTPRRGKNAWIYCGASPKKFKKFFRKLVEKSESEGNEFLFLTAWNEWGEGAYLEPDKKHGTKYLYAIKNIQNKGEKKNGKSLLCNWRKTKF